VYKQLAQIPAGSARKDAMRLTRKEKAKLPRLTAYVSIMTRLCRFLASPLRYSAWPGSGGCYGLMA
jgi:hypothetical protein